MVVCFLSTSTLTPEQPCQEGGGDSQPIFKAKTVLVLMYEDPVSYVFQKTSKPPCYSKSPTVQATINEQRLLEKRQAEVSGGSRTVLLGGLR